MIFKKKSTQVVWLSALLSALFLFALTADATAATVYRWRADDGSLGYSDSLKRVPKAYRSKAETRSLGTLGGYKKLTVEDSATRRKHAKAVAERLEYLRELNKALDRGRIVVQTPGGVSILSGSTGESGGLNGLVIPATAVGAEDGEVIRAEAIRRWDPDTQTTRTSVVYRQGDRVIFVRTPKAQREDLSKIPVEPDYAAD